MRELTKDITGKIFNGIKVIRRVENKGKRVMFEAECHCGKIFVTRKDSLNENGIKSCGCLNEHHGTGTRIYHIWSCMKDRVLNPKNKIYKYYGGKGIKICDEWIDFRKFREWAFNNGYEQHLTIDRIDNSKGYNPENCRWVGMDVQAKNRDIALIFKDGVYLIDLIREKNLTKHSARLAFHKSENLNLTSLEFIDFYKNNLRPKVFVEFNGNKMSLREFSKVTGINYSTLTTRKQKYVNENKLEKFSVINGEVLIGGKR